MFGQKRLQSDCFIFSWVFFQPSFGFGLHTLEWHDLCFNTGPTGLTASQSGSSDLNGVFFYHNSSSFLLYSVLGYSYIYLDCFLSYLGKELNFAFVHRSEGNCCSISGILLSTRFLSHRRANLLSTLSEVDIDWEDFTRVWDHCIEGQHSGMAPLPCLVLSGSRNWTKEQVCLSGPGHLSLPCSTCSWMELKE